MKIIVPAKINLMLRTVGLRSDNYHLLQMVNAKSYNVCDEIIVTLDPVKNSIHYSTEALNHLNPDKTLILVEVLTQKYHINNHYHFEVFKHIPEGAGLGGSSVDAAAIIKFILEDNHIRYNKEELYIELSKYGADIPYCLNDDICIVEGIGEKVINTNINFDAPHVIVVPNIYSSTKEVYNVCKSNTIPLEHQKLLNNIYNKDYKALLYNDLYNASITLNEGLKEAYTALSKYGDVIMSGSGSSFVILNFKGDRSKLKKSLPKFQVF